MTTTTLVTAATAATALAAAVTGGAFLTFSTLTTTGLSRLSDTDAMAAMQQINVAAPRSPLFMAFLFVPAAASIALAVRAMARWGQPGSLWILAGAATYVVGVAVMTIAFHVPRNDYLAGLDATTDSQVWRGWLSSWVAGNHVRTVAGIASAAMLVLGLRGEG